MTVGTFFGTERDVKVETHIPWKIVTNRLHRDLRGHLVSSDCGR